LKKSYLLEKKLPPLEKMLSPLEKNYMDFVLVRNLILLAKKMFTHLISIIINVFLY
jgi:hypothetical protein